MKNLKSLVVILIVALTCTTLQAQKMAHIDTQKLIEAMPETKAAQTELERLRNSYDAELASMYKELEAKFKLYESEASNKTEEKLLNTDKMLL
jgi:outer membrane protein